MRTRFTVAIPTHDRRDTVVLAARSALAQDRAPERVVVLCDGCTDGTQDALRAVGDERLVVADLPKAPGYGYAHRDLALEGSDVVVWLGDDDLLLPEHLALVGERFDAGDVELVQTAAAVLGVDDELRWAGRDWAVEHWRRWVLEVENTNPMATIAVRAGAVRAAGGWDGSQPRLGDWDLWKRVLRAGAQTAMVPVPTVVNPRATGRDQPWAQRVAQNARWWARLGDPAELRVLRHRLAALAGADAAELHARAVAAEAEAARVFADAQAAHARAEAAGHEAIAAAAAWREVTDELARVGAAAAAAPAPGRRRRWSGRR